MFFVADKHRLRRLIAITRDDRRPAQQRAGGPFYRIEARAGRLRLTGRAVEAEFLATVYAEGVLFLRVTLFRRALQFMPGTPTIAVQVSAEGLHVGDVTLPLEANDMLLYTDPARAPLRHPEETAAADEDVRRGDGQGLLFGDEPASE